MAQIVIQVHISHSCMISKHNCRWYNDNKEQGFHHSQRQSFPATCCKNSKNEEKTALYRRSSLEITLSVTDGDVRNLCKKRMLCTPLLDFLIQQAAPTAASEEDKSDPNGCTTYLAGLGVKHYIQELNVLLSDMKQHARKIHRIRGSVCAIATNKRSTIKFPIIESHHFYVLVVQSASFSRSL